MMDASRDAGKYMVWLAGLSCGALTRVKDSIEINWSSSSESDNGREIVTIEGGEGG